MRISVTALNNFHFYKTEFRLGGGFLLLDKQKLIDRITMPYESDKMAFGTAFHNAVENKLSSFDWEGKTIEVPETPNGTAEVKGTHTIDDITLSGVVDIYNAGENIAYELKTTANKSLDIYENSIQSLCYMMLFDVLHCSYFVYHYTKVRKDFKGLYKVHHTERKDEYIISLLNEFKEFIIENDLQDYFKDKPKLDWEA